MLLEIDQAFHRTKDVHILHQPPGRKAYRLTAEGEVFVNLLEQVTAAARSAVDGVTATSAKVPMPCTSNCLTYFRKLRDALPPRVPFDIVPLPRRTAELDAASDEGLRINGRSQHPLWLSSALMSDDQHPVRGEVIPINEDVEVLALDLEHLRLLSNEDLKLPNPVTVREVIQTGITILVPTGGPAWQFLQRSYRDWHILRPFQHVAVPDLDYGLKCLGNNLVPGSAMVVHGLELPFHGARLDTPYFYDFADSTSAHYLAVTGVFRDKSVLSPTDDEVFDVIWRTARNLREGDRLF